MAKSGVTPGVSLVWGGFDKAVLGFAQRVNSQKTMLMAEIGEALVSGTVDRFDKGEDPEGNKWEPSERARGTEDTTTKVRRDSKGRILKGSGIKIKGKPAGKTLVDTARLRNSIDYATTPNSVMVGSNVPYARIHQMGGKAGRGRKVTIPARPYLGVSKEDMEEVQDILTNFFAAPFQGKK